MQLSVEILDHIFSFLASHSETLVACSKDPILSPIVERHLYRHVVVQIRVSGTPLSNIVFSPDRLSKLVSEMPRILYHVRILQIEIEHQANGNQIVREQLDEFAKTMLMFPMLECILLTPTGSCAWYWPDVFRSALEDRLNLPTVTEAHLIGGRNFPSSVLDNCKNITKLTISSIESFDVTDSGRVGDPILPQLKSLTLNIPSVSPSLAAWLKRHINELQSLQCPKLPKEVIPELLGECLGTLNRLEIFLGGSQYTTYYTLRTGEIRKNHFPKFSPIPQNVQQLILHAEAILDEHDDQSPTSISSTLPAAAEAINLFAPSLRHLVLGIDLCLSTFSNFTQVDFSPFATLGTASLSIPRIDLYIFTGVSPSALTRAQLISSLGDEDIIRSIEEGRLIIHSEQAAPVYL